MYLKLRQDFRKPICLWSTTNLATCYPIYSGSRDGFGSGKTISDNFGSDNIKSFSYNRICIHNIACARGCGSVFIIYGLEAGSKISKCFGSGLWGSECHIFSKAEGNFNTWSIILIRIRQLNVYGSFPDPDPQPC